jgi:hypothetical protein
LKDGSTMITLIAERVAIEATPSTPLDVSAATGARIGCGLSFAIKRTGV